MARTKFKWKLAIFSYLILVNVFTKSLPIDINLPSLITTDTVFRHAEVPENILETQISVMEDEVVSTENDKHVELIQNYDNSTEEIKDNPLDLILNGTINSSPNKSLRLLQSMKPNQRIQTYAIEISPGDNNDQFRGRAVINIEIEREDEILLYAEDLVIESVLAGILSNAENAIEVFHTIDDDGFLVIIPEPFATTYVLIITYTGRLTSAGQGLYRGQFNDLNYLAMNLHPTNARRVFPCMDEPTASSIISFTFNDFDYPNFISNTIQEDNNLVQFRPLGGPAHLWAVVGHGFSALNSPSNNVNLFVRPGTNQQDLSYASLAINNVFDYLLRWTDNSYFEIHTNQNPQLHIIAFPDVSVDWHGLSVTGVWEPYVVMPSNSGSVKQRSKGFEKIAEALARQWFGYVIYPQNWRYEWVVSGLASYAAWEALREFQSDAVTTDLTMLDINTLFVTEIIQEALYRDSYSVALPLESGSDIFEEDDIREHVYGILKYKAPAIMRMFRLTLGREDQDFMQLAARVLLRGRALQTVNSQIFEDAVNSEWQTAGNNIIDEFEEYLDPWIHSNGYPLVHVGLRSRGVQLTQRRFSYAGMTGSSFLVPITYSESLRPNFESIHPVDRGRMLDAIMNVDTDMDEEEGDYILFNNQGQGYYRVNYDEELWERIIEALADPETRQQIHPLNRATLIDDALNIARTTELDYDIALRVVLTMEHETEYAPWRAFIRNMDFLRKRLVAMVEDDEDLDPDIYLRMVRRTIGAFEREIGFTPDINIAEQAMVSLTRGIVMDHACRANYQPCIAAALDWFWNPNNNEVVNSDIPADIRPAVYCTSVREGGANIISALEAQLEVETNLYERLVILESMACSSDGNFISGYLLDTLGTNSPYTPEEGLSIFKAVAAASTANADRARQFLQGYPNAILQRYGGNAKLEEAIYVLGQNLGGRDSAEDFVRWVNQQNNGLEESNEPANRTANMVREDLDWQGVYLEEVYEWIDENDAATLFVSSILILASVTIAVFNH